MITLVPLRYRNVLPQSASGAKIKNIFYCNYNHSYSTVGKTFTKYYMSRNCTKYFIARDPYLKNHTFMVEEW